MTFDEWIDDNMDSLHEFTILGDLRRAFNAGMMADVHTDNSKVIETLEKENAELKEALKHFNPCCEWNDDVHACEFMVRAPEYARELEKAKAIIKELSDTYFMDINEKTEERQNIRNRAIAFLNGGEQ